MTVDKILEELREKNLYRTLEKPWGLSFVHNDYLNLSQHSELKEAGHRALDLFGAGSRGSRLLGGHQALFEEVEAEIANFFGAPSCLFFSTGYLANLAAIQAAGEFSDCIVSDEKNHASLIDAIRLTQKPKRILKHNAWEQAPKQKRVLVVAESLYSMDGDFVRLDPLVQYLHQGDSFLVLDEAHAAGVFYEDGSGLSSGKRDWKKMVVVVTFGKAFGCAGAAVLCSNNFRELLINRARSFIYSTAPSPVVVAMVGQAVQILKKEAWRRQDLWERGRVVRQIFRESNCPIPAHVSDWEECSPILPFFIPGEVRALRFCENVRQVGIQVRAIRYPTVSLGKDRIRISLNLAVSRENTEAMARELVRLWTEFLLQEQTQG